MNYTKKKIKDLIKGKKWTSVLWKYSNDSKEAILERVGSDKFYMIYAYLAEEIVLYVNDNVYRFKATEKEYDSIIKPYLKFIN